MAKIGIKEQQRREMREKTAGTPKARVDTKAASDLAAAAAKDANAAADALFCSYPACKCVVQTSTSEPEPKCPKGLTKPEPKKAAAKPKVEAKEARPEKENVMRKKEKKKSAPRTAVKGKTSAPKKVDRSPLAVGTFIAAAGAEGVAMSDIEKKFVMDAHPLRAKIYDARHKLGFDIKHDAKAKRYLGNAPKATKEKAA
jgi:hypothetical protein